MLSNVNGHLQRMVPNVALMDAPMYPTPMIPEHDFQAQMTSNFPFKGPGDDMVSRSDMLGYSWLWIQKQELLIKTLTGFTYNLQGLPVADRKCTLDVWMQVSLALSLSHFHHCSAHFAFAPSKAYLMQEREQIRDAMTHFDDGLAQMRYILERLFDEEGSEDDLELQKARTDVDNAKPQLDISRYCWCRRVNGECLTNNVAFYQHDTAALITPGEVLGPANMSLLSRRSKLEKAIDSWEDLGTLLRGSKDYDAAHEKLTKLAVCARGKNATPADHRRAYQTFHPEPNGLHASFAAASSNSNAGTSLVSNRPTAIGQMPPNFGNQGSMATGGMPIQAQQDVNGGVRHPIGRVL